MYVVADTYDGTDFQTWMKFELHFITPLMAQPLNHKYILRTNFWSLTVNGLLASHNLRAFFSSLFL